MILEKGHKSSAFRLFGLLLIIMASIGLVAYFMNVSTEKTNKVSFQAAGVKYKKQFIAVDVKSLPEMPTEVKQRKNTPSSKSTRDDKNTKSTYKKSLPNETESNRSSLEDESRTNLSLTRVAKQPEESIETGSDLQVLSSFDCVKSIPTVLLDYISNAFLNEYGRSHEDFHFQYETDKTLPLLKQFNINCDVDQNCSASFQYDKQYGLDTTADNTYRREKVFYCCPSAHSLSNETVSDICKRAQTVAGKSVFRENKDPTFLESVIKLFLMQYFFDQLTKQNFLILVKNLHIIK